MPGRKGAPGDKGARAGNVHLETNFFYGGLFLARGGQGQQGGRGEDGGPGGNGYTFPNAVRYFPSHSVGNPFPYDMRVLQGAAGGSPGIGGDGGPGGNGGYIFIAAERVEAVTAGVNYFDSDVVGGAGGDVGEVGIPGSPGQAGSADLMPIGLRAKDDYMIHDSGEFLGQRGQENREVLGTNKPGSPGLNGTHNLKGF